MAERELDALQIFREALDTDPDDRERFIAQCCNGDSPLYARVQAMLRGVTADDSADMADDPADAAFTASSSVDSLIGTLLGPFRVVERIGRGGMGIVYRGQREGADFAQEVAIKLIRRGFDFDDVQARFLRERRILSRLSHPNLARFIDGGIAPDTRPWFALEYVRGSTIHAWCDANLLTVPERVRIFMDLCAAVQHAHTQLIVHRDIKPGNVLVDETGTVRLLDFGIARILAANDDVPSEFPTAIGNATFTPEFASPEQIRGEAAGVASDVFALGVLLYFLLTDALPYAIHPDKQAVGRLRDFDTPPMALTQAIVAKAFESDSRSGRSGARRISTTDGLAPLSGRVQSADALMTDGLQPSDSIHHRLEKRSTTLRAFRQAVRGDLTRIIETALAREPGRRYATVAAFSEDLNRWLHGAPVRVSGNRLGYRLGKFIRRNAIAVALSVTLATALVGAAAWAVHSALSERHQRTIALLEAERNLQIKDQLIALFLQPEDSRLGSDRTSAREFLDQATVRLKKLQSGSEVRSELAGVLVGIYANLGQWHRSASLAESELGGMPVTGARAVTADLRLVTGWALAEWVIGNTEGISDPLALAIDHAQNRRSKVYIDALQTHASLLIAQGRFAEAIRNGEEILTLLADRDPGSKSHITARLELAAAYVGNRQVREGRAQSELALVEVGSDDSILHVQATTMAGLRRALFGDFTSAQTLFDDGAAQWKRLGMRISMPFDEMSYAVNAFDLGALDRSIALLDEMTSQLRTLDHTPTAAPFADPYWLRGEIDLHQGNYAEAATAFSSAADLARRGDTHSRRQAAYYFALQSVALSRSDHLAEADHALELADRAEFSRRLPDFASVALLAAHAVLLSERHQHAQAVATFDQALAELDAARHQPAVLEDQLKENHDALRVRVWKLKAQLAAGQTEAAAVTASRARQLGMQTLGAQHPFMRELDALTKSPPGK